ncbi:MAG TPA: hypothetical protein VJN93_02800 [Candidatus Acidoferrum sp.]|nr:hypothetical protein [Candidatus Acidoferrum sp.]
MQYRAGDILLPASGTFVADSGRSIFLEQSYEQRGLQRNFRWEIPYQYIVRLQEKANPSEGADGNGLGPAAKVQSAATTSHAVSDVHAANNEKNETNGGAAGMLPLQNRPKTA